MKLLKTIGKCNAIEGFVKHMLNKWPQILSDLVLANGGWKMYLMSIVYCFNQLKEITTN